MWRKHPSVTLRKAAENTFTCVSPYTIFPSTLIFRPPLVWIALISSVVCEMNEVIGKGNWCIEVRNYDVAHLHSRSLRVCVCVHLVFVRTCSDWSVYGVAIVSLMLMGKD